MKKWKKLEFVTKFFSTNRKNTFFLDCLGLFWQETFLAFIVLFVISHLLEQFDPILIKIKPEIQGNANLHHPFHDTRQK